MANQKVVDVSITVTCMEEDVSAVRSQMKEWYESTDIPLVQRSSGGIKNGEPKRMASWMKAAFGLE